jgi:hypothetical protein
MSARQEPIRWRKSGYSGGNGGECVELAHTGDAVRDSKNPAGPTLGVKFAGLVSAVRTGQIGR